MERRFLLNEFEIILSEHILMQDILGTDYSNPISDLPEPNVFECKCRKTCTRQACAERDARKSS